MERERERERNERNKIKWNRIQMGRWKMNTNKSLGYRVIATDGI